MDDSNPRAQEPQAASDPTGWPPAQQAQPDHRSAARAKDERETAAQGVAMPGAGPWTAPIREPVRTVAVKKGQSANIMVLLVGAVVSAAVALIGAAVWLASKPPAPQAQRQAPVIAPQAHRPAPVITPAKPEAVRTSTAAPAQPVLPSPRPSLEAAQPASPLTGQAETSTPAHASSRKAIPPAVPVTRSRPAVSPVGPVKRPPTRTRRQQPPGPESAEPAPRWSGPDQMGSWYKFSEREGGN